MLVKSMDAGRRENSPAAHLSIQWSITTQCSKRCKHCYMFTQDTFRSERENTLGFSGLMAVLDRFCAFEQKFNAVINNFYITGGDPLMREDWFEFLSELRSRGKTASLMCNPESLDETAVKKLRQLGIKGVQLSLDGLEDIHDAMRSPGSFQQTLQAIARLNAHGIPCKIMFTLFPTNSNQLIPLMNFLAQNTSTQGFSFDLGCRFGKKNELEKEFTARDVRSLFSAFLEEKNKLSRAGYPMRVMEKSYLLQVSRFEKGLFYPIPPASAPVLSGCPIGWESAAVLADGTVLGCRRLPIPLGKMPEQSFEEIFLGSRLLRQFRRAEYFETCGTCDFYASCRGCPALAASRTGDPFAHNPVCFRQDLPRTGVLTEGRVGPPLDLSFQEEWDLIGSRHRSLSSFCDHLQRPNFQHAYLSLIQDEEQRQKFFSAPKAFVSASPYPSLTNDQTALLLYLVLQKDRQYEDFLQPDIAKNLARISDYALDRLMQSLNL